MTREKNTWLHHFPVSSVFPSFIISRVFGKKTMSIHKALPAFVHSKFPSTHWIRFSWWSLPWPSKRPLLWWRISLHQLQYIGLQFLLEITSSGHPDLPQWHPTSSSKFVLSTKHRDNNCQPKSCDSLCGLDVELHYFSSRHPSSTHPIFFAML